VLFSFDVFSLDTDRRELRRGVTAIDVEPQVFDLIVFLIENRERVVSRDDLIAAIWNGRVVSESTFTSRINSARRALDDSGKSQHLIRTLPRKGFRFVGEIREANERMPPQAAAVPASSGGPDSDRGKVGSTAARRASIAVMPFADRSAATVVPGGPADGLVHDVITRIAKLRSLFVIAQGTVFALRDRRVAPEEAGRMLNVDYVVSGSFCRQDKRFTVSVELVDTRTARIVWAEVFNLKIDDTFVVLDELGNKIVASIAQEIETLERNRAIVKPPNSLDAWEAHHRGLWHMYRFTRADNEQAQHFFETAVRLDPTFAPPLAGLSFTHFQNAFQDWAKREVEASRAYDAARQGLMVDDRDPAAHWAMGRALWLRGDPDQSIIEFTQAVDLSPNFALAHYNLGFVNATAGDPQAAIPSCDYSRDLSPHDPMLFGMFGARAMALVRLRRFDEAADWAVKAAARPNAFAHILAIAAFSLALAGRLDEARGYLASIRNTLPHYGIEDFLTAMRFESDGGSLFREGAKKLAWHE
jgi:TolB-like protein/Flp pilus assembly protein TadD